MKRARGCGGRFLNTKKLDNNSTNPTSEKEPKSGTTVSTQSGNSSSSEYWPSNSNGNSDQYRHISHASSHGNINGHGLSSMHHFRSIDGGGVDWFDQEKGSVFVNQAPRGATTTK